MATFSLMVIVEDFRISYVLLDASPIYMYVCIYIYTRLGVAFF